MYEVNYHFGTNYGEECKCYQLYEVGKGAIPQHLRYVTVKDDKNDDILAIYGIKGYTIICQNDIDGVNKMVSLTGDEFSREHWMTCLSYQDAEIFYCDLDTMLRSFQLIRKFQRMSAWRLRKALQKYIMKKEGICYTGEIVPAL